MSSANKYVKGSVGQVLKMAPNIDNTKSKFSDNLSSKVASSN